MKFSNMKAMLYIKKIRAIVPLSALEERTRKMIYEKELSQAEEKRSAVLKSRKQRRETERNTLVLERLKRYSVMEETIQQLQKAADTTKTSFNTTNNTNSSSSAFGSASTASIPTTTAPTPTLTPSVTTTTTTPAPLQTVRSVTKQLNDAYASDAAEDKKI
eukprot:TRINITY_DN2859_c0_g1_i1.p2 TRINITY_DN2859_c0_g1~~TRINITY_DN2859_c0_g1_i1.p2  ORF type:complete len:161 (+),score=36.66 TRINITY_DN2859_c0_g1_i1:504-986(+)